MAICPVRSQIEAGVWFQRIQANDNLAQNQFGQASFSSLQNFLLGKISTFSVVPSPTELGWRSLEGAEIDLLAVDDQTSESVATESSAPPDSPVSEAGSAEEQSDLQSVEAAEDEGMATAEQRDRGENDPAA